MKAAEWIGRSENKIFINSRIPLYRGNGLCYSYRTICGNLNILITNLKVSQAVIRHRIPDWKRKHNMVRDRKPDKDSLWRRFRNGGKMNRKLMALVAASGLIFGVCMAVSAEEKKPGATREQLHSAGAIVYREGEEKVVVDSQDLYQIADRLDLFKTSVAGQLAVMSTYLTAGEGTPLQSDTDVKVTHVSPSEENRVDPLAVGFDTLLEGVAASQSIPADTAAYGYEPGVSLYRTAQGALTFAGEEGAEEIRIVPATAESLSAGTAAWVDGQLLLGNGGSNREYYEKGQGQVGDTISSLISVIYSGRNETRGYAVSGRDGSGLQVSIDSKESAGPNTARIRSELIPVWNLEGEKKELLTNIGFQVSSDTHGARRDDDSTIGYADIRCTVYDQNGQAIGSGYAHSSINGGVEPLVIDAMTMPISTQYIYIEADGNVSVVKEGHGSGHGTASIEFHGLQATYLIN